MSQTKRPDPDHILQVLDQQSRLQKRGRLKIFFGGSAGVGKTFAMLQAAHQEQLAGRKVLVGVVETHGRKETQKVLEGLTVLARKQYARGNVQIEEFDIDSALKAKPELILIDELAHTNAIGSRHPKRWKDVEELLDAGIDVYTTLNVQHLEGFNDVVASITGVMVQETVPDILFDEANEIQLVDIPTEELLERLSEGKVYVTPGAADRAAQNFFSKTNLMSLRELALRRTAEHVDADADYQRVQDGIFTPNTAGDRVLVCIGQDELGMKLVRTARKLANSLKAPLYAVAIESSENKDSPNYYRQQRALSVAEKNGAFKAVTIQEEKIGDAILNYAVSNGVTKIMIGRRIRPAWMDWVFGSLVEYVIRHSGNIDVYVLTGHRSKSVRKNHFLNFKLVDYIWVTGILAGCTAFGFLLRDFFQPVDIIMIYLMGVIMCAIKFGRLPSFLFVLLSLCTLNFFFIEPIFTFTIFDGSYWLSLLVMLITSFVISEQASRLKRQTILSRQRESRTQIFYGLTKELAAKRDDKSVIETTLTHLKEALGMPTAFWRSPDGNGLEPVGGGAYNDRLKEEMVAIWAYQNEQAAGVGTDTMPSAVGYYYPLISENRKLGVLSVEPKAGVSELSVEQKVTVETFSRLLTTALERVSATQSAERMKIDSEAEKLKNTFLSSMSHDLRTPLATIKGSSETLLNAWRDLADDVRQRLLTGIHDESERLSRIVRNLLDLTRFETGHIAIRQEPYYLQEIIGAITNRIEKAIPDIFISAKIPSDLPMVNVDALLIEQVFQNLIENAAGFSGINGKITIDAITEDNMVLVSVCDNGPGLKPGTEAQIFNKFFTMAQKDRPKGAGLGLAICQAIIQAHGGSIFAQNQNNGGACFSFSLPVFKADAAYE